MIPSVMSTVTVVAVDAPGWRPYLREFAAVTLEIYRRHPWLFDVPFNGPPIMPNQMRYLEATLTALHDTGLDDREQLDVTMTISYLARGAAQIAMGILQAERDSGLEPGAVDALNAAAYRRVLDPERFPHASRVLSDVTAPQQPEDDWEDLGVRFGIERFLDGIEALIERRAASGPTELTRRTTGRGAAHGPRRR